MSLKLSDTQSLSASNTSLQVNAWVAQSGGLHATYFDDELLTEALFVREDVTVDFSGTGDVSSSTEWPGASAQAVTGATFAVKWGGFVHPKPYTLNLKP